MSRAAGAADAALEGDPAGDALLDALAAEREQGGARQIPGSARLGPAAAARALSTMLLGNEVKSYCYHLK